MALPAKESYARHSRNSVPRTLSLDRQTDALLMKMSCGQLSAFVRGLIWKELGRRQALAELKGVAVESIDAVVV